jgi:hypothetical protein
MARVVVVKVLNVALLGKRGSAAATLPVQTVRAEKAVKAVKATRPRGRVFFMGRLLLLWWFCCQSGRRAPEKLPGE